MFFTNKLFWVTVIPLIYSLMGFFFQNLTVSYIPAEVYTRPGADVTVYGVFHNHSWNASKAVWMLNGQMLPESQYRMINERVSAVTITSKEPGFDTLMCCYPWGQRYKCSIAYTKVYVEGEINCGTSSDFSHWYKMLSRLWCLLMAANKMPYSRELLYIQL